MSCSHCACVLWTASPAPARRQADDRLGVTRWFSEELCDDRDSARVVHDRLEQCRQRIYQIGLGYEDCNASDTLRHDPLLKTVCGRLPKDEQGLSSQPTLSRFENSMDWITIRRLIRCFEEGYVASLPSDTTEVILDIDATDDEPHGAQQLSFFHGYYDHHMYHPLLLFDGTSGHRLAFLRFDVAKRAAQANYHLSSCFFAHEGDRMWQDVDWFDLDPRHAVLMTVFSFGQMH